MPLHGKMTFSFNDKSAENSSLQLNVATVDELNYVAQTALRDAFRTALDAICLGLPTTETISNVNKINPTTLASASGNREVKYLVRYYDTVTMLNGSLEVPIADDSITLPASDEVDPANALWIQFVSALEAYAISNAGNPIVVTGARLVGRNI